jgi:hypothetical protein
MRRQQNWRIWLAAGALLALSLGVLAQTAGKILKAKADARAEQEIRKLLGELSEARLRSDLTVPSRIFGDDLALTSQSGKLYGKADALQDFANPVEEYRDEELIFRFYGDTALVNLVNQRKRKGMEAAKFRVTSVWIKRSRQWFMVAMQTTRIG